MAKEATIMKKLVLFVSLASLFAFVFLLRSGSAPRAKEQPVRYVVVGSFNDVVAEFEDKEVAFKTANELTLMGRVFPSKPFYFVLER